MRRLRQRQGETVAAALEFVPDRLLDKVGCDVFCGDPIFAGLYVSAWDNETTDDGRCFRRLAHVGWPYHTRDKRTTMVLPAEESVYTVLHELGHVLHWALSEHERDGVWAAADLVPTTEYAFKNQWETFAEAFVGWFYTPRWRDEHPYWLCYSRENDEFFDRLCRN